jgi:NAD(P)-dependent dehydrogenase (short-subunit alcohol dehydrogenase family)
MNTTSLTDQSAIITGSGRGIGRAYALEFARRGANVVVNDVDKTAAVAVVDEIIAAGGSAFPSFDSVATREGAQATFDSAMAEFGSPTVLVNNAGVLRTGYFQDLTDERIDEVLDVHLRAAFRITQLVWPSMMDRSYGRIVMTSSASGMFSHQGLSNYAAAKAGLYGLMKALAFEGRDHGIAVNAILPAALSSSPVKEEIPDMRKYTSAYRTAPPPDQAWRVDPAAVAPFVAYLCSPQCDVTGEAFSVAGGRCARVFVGIADGWTAPDPESLTAENIAEHMHEIRDVTNFTVPWSVFET